MMYLYDLLKVIRNAPVSSVQNHSVASMNPVYSAFVRAFGEGISMEYLLDY